MENLNHLKDELIKCGHLLDKKNLTPATSGNISMRCGENYLISASGSCLGDLSYDDIVLIDEHANVLDGGRKPSSEKFMHIETYKTRPDIDAFIHCHSPKTTAFSVAGIAMEAPILSEFVYYFNKIPLAQYAAPSSSKLVEYTVPHFQGSNAVLMANHGIAVCAKTLKEAFYFVESIETYADVYLGAKLLGNMNYLTQEEIEEINQLHQK